VPGKTSPAGFVIDCLHEPVTQAMMKERRTRLAALDGGRAELEKRLARLLFMPDSGREEARRLNRMLEPRLSRSDLTTISTASLPESPRR